MELKNSKIEKGVLSRFRDKKNQKGSKFLAVFGPPKGDFGPNFQKNIFFVITEYRLKV